MPRWWWWALWSKECTHPLNDAVALGLSRRCRDQVCVMFLVCLNTPSQFKAHCHHLWFKVSRKTEEQILAELWLWLQRLSRSPPLSRNRDFGQMASVFEPSIFRNVRIWSWAKGNHFISTKIALSYWWPEVLSCHEITSCTLQELEIQRKVWYCRLSTCKGLNQRAAPSSLSDSLPDECRFSWEQWVKERHR